MQKFLTTIISRPIAVAMLMLAAAATGLYQAFHLPLELTPEVVFGLLVGIKLSISCRSSV